MPQVQHPKEDHSERAPFGLQVFHWTHRRWRALQDGDALNNADAGPSRKRPCPGTPPVTTPPSTPPQPSQPLLPISPVNPEPISADIPQPPPEQPAPQPNAAPVPAPCTWILEAYDVTRPDDYEIEVIVHKRKGETIYSHLYSKADGVKEQYRHICSPMGASALLCGELTMKRAMCEQRVGLPCTKHLAGGVPAALRRRR